MKLRWIGVAGLVLILSSLILGALGATLAPGMFWNVANRRTVSPSMMGSGMMGTMDNGSMGSGMMNGDMMGGGMMSDGMMNVGPTEASAPFDQRFLDQMIIHHQSAVMSAQMMIADSARPELRDLAQRIIGGQQREIDQMRQWRQDWYGATNAGSTPDMMGGMMNRDQMRQMMGANVDLDQMFLQMMIPHHEAAITIAEQALEQAEHPEIKTLAQEIISTQRAEIAKMQGYLSDWYGAQSP
jgi:uncharacterized protein (DUF305 family)